MLYVNGRSLLALVALFASACVGGAGSPTSAGSETSDSSDSATSGSETSGSETSGSGDGDGDQQCTPELEAMRADIFTPSCALPSCHSSADAAAGLDLEAEDLEAQLVGAPAGTCDGWVRVVPKAPDESLLYLKVAGPAPCGALMPPPAGLPAEQSACIRTWIEQLDAASCETCGGDACIDLTSDIQHCGECGNACPTGVPCEAGECACPGGQQLCNDVCVDLQSDPAHCGDCAIACDPGQVCARGGCSNDCGDLADCGGACVDLTSHPEHCGECGNSCGQGVTCELGNCGCPGDGVSFAVEVEPMLADGCAGMGCHASPAPSAGLDLRVGFAYDELVGVPSEQCDNRLLVAPGQPGSSYLIDKLLGVNMCFGGKMPKTGPAFSAEQIATISEWICRGAMND